jgi:hypothetical protein
LTIIGIVLPCSSCVGSTVPPPAFGRHEDEGA